MRFFRFCGTIDKLRPVREAMLDVDGDGVPNDEDDCPFVPGSEKLNGCLI